MNNLNRLGIRTALIAGLTAAILLAGVWAVRRLFEQPDTASNSTKSSQASAQDATSDIPDQDSDGLPDAFEPYYQTDPNNADSDNDGTSDFDELAAGRDPNLPGPDDETKPATGTAVTDLGTYTNKYLAQLPDQISRTEILAPERIEAFIAQERSELLPTISEDDLTFTDDAGKAAISKYLDSIASTHNDDLHVVTNDDIAAALTAQLSQQPEPMNTIVEQLEQNIKTYKAVPAPAEAADLHRLLVTASQALLDNVMLLHGTNTDVIGSLLASKNIDDLTAVFQDITNQIRDLEQKYQLE